MTEQDTRANFSVDWEQEGYKTGRNMISLEGEVTSIGRSVLDRNAQKIEIEFLANKLVAGLTVYVTFKGVSPYALGQKLTLTLSESDEQPF